MSKSSNVQVQSENNVVSLAVYRNNTPTPAPQEQEVPESERRYLQAVEAEEPSHVEASLWCLVWFDRKPEVAYMLNQWEVEFLESMSLRECPATERQNRCLNRIIYIINGTLSRLERQQEQEQQQPPPTPPDAA